MSFVIIVITLTILFMFFQYTSKEYFRGGRRGGRRGGGFRRRGFNPNRYVRRLRRRNNYFPYWNNVTMWPSSWYPSYTPCNCKRGCTPDGCAYPGNGPYDCVWASDCNCC